MNSPADLSEKLTRQWHSPHLREQRLLSRNAWPLELPIGRPDADQLARAPAQVRRHLQRWREVRIGDVVWGEQGYRAAAEPVTLPLRWRLHKPSEWVRACGDPQVSDDYELLSRLISRVDPSFHTQLIRQLPQLRDMPESEIVETVSIALQLEPGIARGKPLRALSMGVDSKFFERNRRLLIGLLDRRFDGDVSEQGLEVFLGAASERGHWLLVAPLTAGLLPFDQQRVRASELQHRPLPAGHILVIENEQCLHQLPSLPDAIAVLGAGLNLGWMQAPWLAERNLAYWGDLDTWGLAMLGRARTSQPRAQALMMDREIFDRFAARSVEEPAPYRDENPPGLTAAELQLFGYLLGRKKGRLEQELLPVDIVERAIFEWGRS